MTELRLNIRKTLEKNAVTYFENAKKMAAKIDGIKETIQKFTKQLEELEEKQEIEQEKQKQKITVEKKWYDKFHWFISSEGFLCVGGRDATTNEVVIKKYTDKDDIVFHTEAPGSPFFVIKKEGDKKIGEETIKECAQATASYSKAWKLGVAATEVFWIMPSQASKQTESGEYMPKGAFMIRGKRNNVNTELKLALGITKEGKIMGGPQTAIEKNCEKHVLIVQGTDKSSDAAKKIQKIFGKGEINDIIAALPAGGCKVLSHKI